MQKKDVEFAALPELFPAFDDAVHVRGFDDGSLLIIDHPTVSQQFDGSHYDGCVSLF